MAQEPSYPKDATVGEAAPQPAASAGKEEAPTRRSKHLVAGAAIGIGSAAIVAALLYANRNRKNDR
ncbi:MAG TPA: hypothetical protein VGB59_08855 [Allosphingosinicella sp.]